VSVSARLASQEQRRHAALVLPYQPRRRDTIYHYAAECGCGERPSKTVTECCCPHPAQLKNPRPPQSVDRPSRPAHRRRQSPGANATPPRRRCTPPHPDSDPCNVRNPDIANPLPPPPKTGAGYSLHTNISRTCHPPCANRIGRFLSDTISNPQLHPQQLRRFRWISIEYPGRSRVRMRGQCPKASPLIPVPIAVTTVISTKRTPPRGAGFIFLFRSRTRSPRRSVLAISDGIMTGTGIERRMRGNPTRTCQPRRHCHDRTDAGHHHQGR